MQNEYILFLDNKGSIYTFIKLWHGGWSLTLLHCWCSYTSSWGIVCGLSDPFAKGTSILSQSHSCSSSTWKISLQSTMHWCNVKLLILPLSHLYNCSADRKCDSSHFWWSSPCAITVESWQQTLLKDVEITLNVSIIMVMQNWPQETDLSEQFSHYKKSHHWELFCTPKVLSSYWPGGTTKLAMRHYKQQLWERGHTFYSTASKLWYLSIVATLGHEKIGCYRGGLTT